MIAESSLVGPHLQAFFSSYLRVQKQASPETVASYRDTFRLLLQFVRSTRGVEPSSLHLGDLDAPLILAFLDHLEKQRKNSVRSRNLRLAAVRSFFRLVTLRDPASISIAQRVLAIPVKREDKRLIGYLTRPEVDALLAAPDRSHWLGRRDHALLLTMYNSGARVSELVALKRDQASLGTTSCLHLHGKGRKERSVPLWPQTARTLRAWFGEHARPGSAPAFTNARGTMLSRDGVDYILKKSVRLASVHCSSLKSKTVSCHVIRHSTAMHLLQAGVDIAVIALWLGHASLETTHAYLEADLATKERALEKLAAVKGRFSRFHPDDELLAFLKAL